MVYTSAVGLLAICDVICKLISNLSFEISNAFCSAIQIYDILIIAILLKTFSTIKLYAPRWYIQYQTFVMTIECRNR